MRLIGLMPVRNEDWILGLSLRVALLWCDEVIVLLHASMDRSAQIANEVKREHEGRVTTMVAMKYDWDEMQHRQAMLVRARERGATHIAMIDADEILSGNLIGHGPDNDRGTFRSEVCHGVPPGHILQLPGYNLRGSLNRYHANGIWGRRWFSLTFQDDPRLGWSGDTFHRREPQGAILQPYRPVEQGQGGILHLWGASERRLKAKHFWYQLTERQRWPSKPVEDIRRLYSLAITPTEPWTFTEVPVEWWAAYAPLMKYLDLETEPWHERECRRIVKENPGIDNGLDDFGVL